MRESTKGEISDHVRPVRPDLCTIAKSRERERRPALYGDSCRREGKKEELNRRPFPATLSRSSFVSPPTFRPIRDLIVAHSFALFWLGCSRLALASEQHAGGQQQCHGD